MDVKFQRVFSLKLLFHRLLPRMQAAGFSLAR
jgi:hypothetical protein